MSVKIGSARSSYGNTSPGDQSGGKEVSTQSWYLHSKGWYVARPKSAAVAEKIAQAMERACANNLIGYDQGTRNTLYNAVKDKGFDPAKITKAVNTDCSALVRVCCAYAGINLPNFTTDTELSALSASGAFTLMVDSKHCDSSDYLCRGDILDTRTKGHTVVVLSDGAKVQRRTDDLKRVTIADGTWFVREGAGKEFPDVDTVHGGEVYEQLDVNRDGWVRIGAGWISPKAVKSIG